MSSRTASSVGTDRSSTRASSTSSTSPYRRWKRVRPAMATSPKRKRYSSARFTADQPHHGPVRVLASCSISLAARGPFAASSRRSHSTVSRLASNQPSAAPYRRRYASIRQRNSGQSSLRRNAASCAQYSVCGPRASNVSRSSSERS